MRMKFISAAIAVMLGSLSIQSQAQTADQADQAIPFDVRKTGMVNVVKDREGNIQSIRLVVTSYEITMDDAAKPLENMDGYKVRVTGAFSFDEEGRRWITAKNIETIEAAKPAEPEAAEAKPATEEAAKAEEPAAETKAPAADAEKAEPPKPAEEAAAPEAPAKPAE